MREFGAHEVNHGVAKKRCGQLHAHKERVT
jgi:hypothetical protein